MQIFDLFGKGNGPAAREAEAERPIKFVQDGSNSWRIVYAD